MHLMGKGYFARSYRGEINHEKYISARYKHNMDWSNDKKMPESDDKQGRNETELLRETRFISGSGYEGTWNAIDKTGIGRYVTPHGVVLDGEYRNGMLHGHGSMYWPRGQIMDGTWKRGKMEQRRYTFADGLPYQEEGWNYCIFPERRLAVSE
ncbi:MORN repeat-containing protein [Ooceraea biroi]|uniref:MORN repeat-containing protein 5 n=1 Tax=Ooceraea biroi TaxID=2015173 RepID=A0A026WPP2_OOCBI|nr:MORN repeat-containing protein [Ooceraea biroi]